MSEFTHGYLWCVTGIDYLLKQGCFFFPIGCVEDLISPFLWESPEDIHFIHNIIHVNRFFLFDLIGAKWGFRSPFLWDHWNLIMRFPKPFQLLFRRLFQTLAILLDKIKPYPFDSLFKQIQGICLHYITFLVVEDIHYLSIVRFEIVQLFDSICP